MQALAGGPSACRAAARPFQRNGLAVSVCRPPRFNSVRTRAGQDGNPSGSSSNWQAGLEGRPTGVRRAPIPAADPELLQVLELASDEELEDLFRLLHGRSLFSPLVKSIVVERDELSAALHGRELLISRIDSRLRFLAADSAATLKGRWPDYRSVLLMIRDKLGLRCPTTLLTNELEAEIFLALLEKHADAVAGAEVAGEASAAAAYADQGDGGAASAADQQRKRKQRPSVVQRLLAPLRLGQEEVVPALARLGSALAVSNLQQSLVHKLGTKLVHSHVRYEAALHLALTAGSKGVQGRVAVKAATEGISVAATRYAAARSMLSVLGPLMWASTALDLLLVSIGTDYSRVVKAVFALAQIRLLRTHGFSSPAS